MTRPRRPIRSLALAGAGLGLMMLAACATGSGPVAASSTPVDLPRFMGEWHVIAHVPYFGERGHVASSDTYTLRPDGGIDVRYTYRTGFDQPVKTFDSRATVKDGTGNRDWTTWFFRIIPTKFRILEVAPDYSWALIGYPGPRPGLGVRARAGDGRRALRRPGQADGRPRRGHRQALPGAAGARAGRAAGLCRPEGPVGFVVGAASAAMSLPDPGYQQAPVWERRQSRPACLARAWRSRLTSLLQRTGWIFRG